MQQEASTGMHQLQLTRLIKASPEQVYRAWTEPELLKQWFTPRPWTVSAAEMDVRAGGSSLIVMCSPEGEEFPQRGIYLEVVPNRRLVFTDAYTCAWEPSAQPFMTGIISFEEEDDQTRYTAVVRHWSEADMKKHEEMGFYQGWGMATDQLAALVESL